ncbi:MAG TPA: hypothetical protein VJT77_03625 [Burkholderiales bacterium]|nr:hypothetical protein [Burkholderiales bacterium]
MTFDLMRLDWKRILPALQVGCFGVLSSASVERYPRVVALRFPEIVADDCSS